MRECVTVSYGLVSGSAKQWYYVQPALYAEHTTRDGRKVWKYVQHCGFARRSTRAAKNDALRLSVNLGIEFIPEVRQWKEIK